MKSIDVSKLFAGSELKFRVSINPIDREVNSRTNSSGQLHSSEFQTTPESNSANSGMYHDVVFRNQKSVPEIWILNYLPKLRTCSGLKYPCSMLKPGNIAAV